MEDIIKALEKAMVGTVVRGLLWVFAWVSATFGVQAPAEDTAASIAAWVGAIFAVLLAMAWSYVKDRLWKATSSGR